MGTGPVNGIALAGTVAVHAALVLAPVASSRVHEPPAPVMSVVRVRIVAPPPEASPAPRRAGPPVNVAASAKPEPEVVRAAERRDPPLESTSLAAPGDSAMPATSATEAVTAPAFSLANASLPQVEKVAATPASRPVAFLSAPEPDYPASAREEGQEGLVVLRVRISREGYPMEILLAGSSGIRALDAAAFAAVKRWTFRPARVADRDVEAWMDVPIRFRLR